MQTPAQVTSVGTAGGRHRRGLERLSPRAQNVLVFTGSLLGITALKWPVLNQPPVWDSSMSVFPAAITLADQGFDLLWLLDQPGYAEGGPNVHTVSLITWATAVVVRLLGGGSLLLPTLHLLHFALAAAAVAGVYHIGRIMLGSGLAAGTTLAAFALPVVLTQVGFMHLEIALLVTTVWAMIAWVEGRTVKAVLWATAAALLKGSGIIVAAALAGMALFDPRVDRRSIGKALWILPAPVLATWLQAHTSAVATGSELAGHLSVLAGYLVRVPDLLVLLLAYTVLTLLAAPWRDGRLLAEAEGMKVAYATSITILTACLLGFYLLLPVVGVGFSVLPRYYVQILPLILIGLLYLARTRGLTVFAYVFLVMLLAYSVANRNGSLYPTRELENFALIERSGEYRDLLGLHLQGVAALQEAAESGPVFYAQPDHYRLNYPLMGYAEEPLPNGHSIRHEFPYRNGRIEDFPDSFAMLLDMAWLGGEIMADIWRQAEEDPTRSVEITVLQSGPFMSVLIQVDTVAR